MPSRDIGHVSTGVPLDLFPGKWDKPSTECVTRSPSVLSIMVSFGREIQGSGALAHPGLLSHTGPGARRRPAGSQPVCTW